MGVGNPTIALLYAHDLPNSHSRFTPISLLLANLCQGWYFSLTSYTYLFCSAYSLPIYWNIYVSNNELASYYLKAIITANIYMGFIFGRPFIRG